MAFGKSGHHNGVFSLRHIIKKIITFTVSRFSHPVDFLPGKKKIAGGAQFGKDNDVRRDLFNQLLHAGEIFLFLIEFGCKLDNRYLQGFHQSYLLPAVILI